MLDSCLVLVSGGIDSTVLLHQLAAEQRAGSIVALAFDYGQRHVRELECARWQAERAGAQFRTVRMDFFRELVRPATTLVAGAEPVPDLEDIPDRDRVQPPTYVPNRNMVLLSIAAAAAEGMGISEVYYGAQAQDEYGYWDCTQEFVARINALLALNRRRPVTVVAPLVRNSKADNVQLGLRLGVDFSWTWSCYRGMLPACGTCPTCVERLKAFALCGVEDPVPYACVADIAKMREKEK